MIPTQLTIAPFVDGEMAMMILVELRVDDGLERVSVPAILDRADPGEFGLFLLNRSIPGASGFAAGSVFAVALFLD